MATFVIFLIMGSMFVLAVLALKGYIDATVHVSNFMNKINRLIDARNHERSIQFCNAVPDSLLANVCKNMIAKFFGKSAKYFELEYQLAVERINASEISFRLISVISLITVFNFSCITYASYLSGFGWWVAIPTTFIALSYIAIVGLGILTNRNKAPMLKAVSELRLKLYKDNGYKPPFT